MYRTPTGAVLVMRHLRRATLEVLLLPLGVIRPSVSSFLVPRARPPKRLRPSRRRALLAAVAAPATGTAFAEQDRAPAPLALKLLAAVRDRILPGAGWTPGSRSAILSKGLLSRSRVASWGPGASTPGPRPVPGYDNNGQFAGEHARRKGQGACALCDVQ